MSSFMWYIYDFARKAWADAFANAKALPELAEKPDRFRNFPKVNKEYCLGCGACTVACPSGAMDLLGFSNKQILAEVDACL